MKKFLPIIVILIVISGAIGYWNWERMAFSKDDIKLEILGPREVELAEEVEFIVRYKNIGHIRLDNPQLVFEFPDNIILKPGLSSRQKLDQEKLGIAIYPGEERTFRFRARLLGAEGESLSARAVLSYQPKGLQARFESETSFTTIIKSVPLTLAFDFPPKIETGKDFEFQINYFSNVDYPLLNLGITTDYPDGFDFIKSIPRALEKKEWEIPPLNKAEGGRITITGRIDAQPGDQKIFRANLGMWQDGRFIILKRANKGIEIIKPTLQIIQKINRREDYVITPGEHLHYEILFENIGDETLTGLYLTINLFGETFDFKTLRAPEGVITGANNITWNWRQVGDLQFLRPQERGQVEFWIQTKEDWPILDLKGEAILQSVIFLGGLKQEFATKINSKLEVDQKAFYQDEIFGNFGPIPPQIGLPTVYTIMWQVKNHHNKVGDVEIKAILSENVKLTGKIFPEQERENFTFDSISREIVWKVGTMEVGQGIINPGPNISFQVEFVPDEFQIGKTPDLIGPVKITGKDLWTGQFLRNRDLAINTTLQDDPSITKEMGIVRR
jgi:hypothetical protein